MSDFTLYRIGRGEQADIRIGHNSVSRLHAEMIMTADGRCYLSDCASRGGTHREKNGEWVPVTQEFVNLTDGLLLGRYRTSVKQLLALAAQGKDRKSGPGDANGPGSGDRQRGTADDDRPHGRVQRDEETGDIIPRGED